MSAFVPSNKENLKSKFPIITDTFSTPATLQLLHGQPCCTLAQSTPWCLPFQHLSGLPNRGVTGRQTDTKTSRAAILAHFSCTHHSARTLQVGFSNWNPPSPIENKQVNISVEVGLTSQKQIGKKLWTNNLYPSTISLQLSYPTATS